MWLRIGDKDFPKNSIKEIYRMGKTIQSGKWCMDIEFTISGDMFTMIPKRITIK